MSEQFVAENMPVLALRGMAVYPEQTVHFDIGRMKSALALEQAMKRDQRLLLVPQKDIWTMTRAFPVCILWERWCRSSRFSRPRERISGSW